MADLGHSGTDPHIGATSIANLFCVAPVSLWRYRDALPAQELTQLLIMSQILIATIAVDSATIKQKIVLREKIRWVYLAKDYKRKQLLSEELGDVFESISITDTLNLVADDIRTEHVELIDSLNRTHIRQLPWWFGVISSRNVYSSNLFLYTCYLVTLQRLWGNTETRPDLIIADSPGLAECIANWISANHFAVNIIKESLPERFVKKIMPFLLYGSSVVSIIARYIAATFTKFGSPLATKDSRYVIVDTFVHENSISDAGDFEDRYFPFLHEFLAKQGHKVLVHPVLYGFGYNYTSIYRRMRKSPTGFIIQEDYLSFSDYLAALLAPLTLIRINIQPVIFHGINLDSVIKEEHRLQSPIPVVQSVLMYRLWNNLIKAGIGVSWVINWYENQVFDKAMIAGIRSVYPDVKILGAQMFIHIPNYLSLYPVQSECEAGLTPDLMLLTGLAECDAALKYTTQVPCKTAAALRYSQLFAGGSSINAQSNEGPVILVLLPAFADEVLEILDTLLGALPELPAGIEYLIKCHPDCLPADIIHSFGGKRWPKVFRFWEGSLAEAFQRAKVVVSSNSSSMVEAVVNGIPTIFLARQSNLNMNPLADSPSVHFATCSDASQLVRAINRFSNLSEEDRCFLLQNGLELRKCYFTDIKESTLKSFEFSEESTCV